MTDSITCGLCGLKFYNMTVTPKHECELARIHKLEQNVTSLQDQANRTFNKINDLKKKSSLNWQDELKRGSSVSGDPDPSMFIGGTISDARKQIVHSILTRPKGERPSIRDSAWDKTPVSVELLRGEFDRLKKIYDMMLNFMYTFDGGEQLVIIMSDKNGRIYTRVNNEEQLGFNHTVLARFGRRGHDTFNVVTDTFNYAAKNINPEYLSKKEVLIHAVERMFCCDTCESEYSPDVSVGDKCPNCETGVYQELSEW